METIGTTRWALMDGIKPEDGCKHIAPDDRNDYTNARTWVKIG